MSITVYSKPRCPQCDATYRAIKGLGYQQAPVVVAGEDHWSGFRPDRIKAIAAVALAMSA